MSSDAKHPGAVTRSLSSAREAAARGDYGDALAWLAVLETAGHSLSAEDQLRRDAWRAILASRSPAQPSANGGASGSVTDRSSGVNVDEPEAV